MPDVLTIVVNRYGFRSEDNNVTSWEYLLRFVKSNPHLLIHQSKDLVIRSSSGGVGAIFIHIRRREQ